MQVRSSQLEAELSTRQDQLLELQKEKLELDSVAHGLRCTIEGLQSELEEAQGSLGDLEESMRRATSTITSLQQVGVCVCVCVCDVPMCMHPPHAKLTAYFACVGAPGLMCP